MEIFVRECNYPNTDSTGDAERSDADLDESSTIRRYDRARRYGQVAYAIERPNDVVRNLRANLPKIFDRDLAHRFTPEPGMIPLCLYCGRAKSWPYHT